MKRMQFVQIALAACFGLSSCSIQKPLCEGVILEQCVGDFSPQEELLVRDAIAKIGRRYPVNLRFSLEKKDIGENNAGEWRDDKVFLQDLSFYTPRDDIWNSIYLPRPTRGQLYQRALNHEIGHILHSRIDSNNLNESLFIIDVKNDVSLMGSGSSHPAHPSFYTFFYSGFPEAAKDGEFVKKNGAETFAETFSLRTLGFLDNPADPLLREKIRIIEAHIRRYEIRS